MSADPRNDQAIDSAPNLLVRIQKALKHHDELARRLQHTRLWRGCSLIVLGPLALVLSAIQSVWKIGGPWGVFLIALESGALLVALIATFWKTGGAHTEWIRERLRTEILRREYFLLAARVGPYLNPGVLHLRVENRMQAIGSTTKDPVEHVPMVTEQGDQTWREELEAAKGQPLPSLPDLASAIGHYLDSRVEHQRKWFAARSAQHGRYASLFENIAKLILVSAVVLAIFHFVKVLWSTDHLYEEPDLLLFLGISLPAVGAGVVGFESFLENERLGSSYAYHSEVLGTFSSRLRTLQSNLSRGELSREEIEFRFMRIVLAVEEMFSEELLQWRLVMEPRKPRAEI